MKWKKQVPDKEGYWLRINAGHNAQLHRIYIPKEEYLPNYNKLCIMWGWGGESSEMTIKGNEKKLRYFMWTGPIPTAPPQKGK